MQQQSVFKLITVLVLSVLFLLIAGCGDDKPKQQASKAATEKTVDPDVIAQVGDQEITFSELNTMLNSSAMVGLSVPALGTPERTQVILTLLDKLISANLTYLDAKKQGADRLTSYTEDVARFEDAVVAALYESAVMVGDIQVSDTEVLHYYNNETNKGEELTDDLKTAIESLLRKRKLDELKANKRARIRENVEVVIDDKVLSPDFDDTRSDADVVATYDNRRITWSLVKDLMRGADQRADRAAFYVDNEEEREKRLDRYIDNAIMAMKGYAAGLDKDPKFIKRTAEYRKTRLINEYRKNLLQSWNPSDDQLRTYYVDHMDVIAVPERRKVQMVVLATKEEAEDIKARIDRGDITMFQAAQQYSTDPNAKSTLGEMGWVAQGTGFEGLDDFTFNLEPEVVGGPVESPAGWHLVKVLDVTDAQYDNIDDPQTRQRTFRAYIKDQMNDYVVDLRKNHFEVAVYEDVLNRKLQEEVDFIAELKKKAQEQGSVTEQRLQELQKYITPPGQVTPGG